MLFNRGYWENSSGFRGMVVRTKTNHFCGGCWRSDSMESLDGAIIEEPLSIRSLVEGINRRQKILAWCALDDVHWFIRDSESCNFGDNLWDTGAFGINVSDGLTNLEGGDSGGIHIFVLLIHLVRETYMRGG